MVSTCLLNRGRLVHYQYPRRLRPLDKITRITQRERDEARFGRYSEAKSLCVDSRPTKYEINGKGTIGQLARSHQLFSEVIRSSHGWSQAARAARV